MEVKPINQISTEDLKDLKKIHEDWKGLPYSYKQIIDELERRERAEQSLDKGNQETITT